MLEEDIGLDGLEPGELYRSNTGFSDEGVSVGRFHRGDLSLEDVRSAVIQRAEDAGWVIHSLSCGRTADVVFAQREIAGRPATLQVIASRTDDGTLVDVQVLSAVRGERLSADGDETPRRCD